MVEPGAEGISRATGRAESLDADSLGSNVLEGNTRLSLTLIAQKKDRARFTARSTWESGLRGR